MRVFRLVWLLAVAAVLIVGAMGMYPVAVVLSAVTVPTLLVVYLYDVDVYERQPWLVLALTVCWGSAIGVLTAVTLRAVTGSALEPAGIGDATTLETVTIPVLGFFLAVLGTVAILLPYRAFNDVLDGTTFGSVSASFASSSQVVVLALPLFSEGLRPAGDTGSWLLVLSELAIAVPLLWAALGATVAGSFWLRFRSAPAVRASIAHPGSPPAAIAVAVGMLACVALARLELSRGLSLAVMLCLLLLALFHLRRLIHAGLVNEALEQPIGPEMDCANCGCATPSHLFCGRCGMARRSLPKGVGGLPVTR